MAAKVWKLVTVRERARMLSLAVTAPSRDRDLRDSAKAMEVDQFIRGENAVYDDQLEELVAEHQRLNRRYAGRQMEPEYQQASARINENIQELDDTTGQEPLTLLMDHRLFTYAKDTFLDQKGVPADRRLGPKYQALRKDLEEARQVEVEEKLHDPEPG